MNNKKIGQFICELRKEKKWTQEDLAEKLLVDRTMVSKWERGIYIPNTEILLEMQKLFNVTINEIIYGERKNNDNNNNVDSIPIKIIKDEKKRFKKLIIVSSLIVICLIFSFFIYYFINNYNSIHVYKVYGENGNFYVSNGILLFSKEKSYIRVGDIENNSSNNINSVRLFFIRDNEEKDIFIGNDSDTKLLFINNFNYNELFNYSDLDYIIKNLKLELKLDNEENVIIDLILSKDYSNNKIIEDLKQPISDNDKVSNINKVPKYVTTNFYYDEEKDSYERENNNILEEYFANTNIYIITIKKSNYEEKIFYDLNDNTLEYNKFENSTIVDNYIYSINLNSCKNGNCNVDFVTEIKEKYLNYIND
ncbi:MAG: helix-turn-helix transcriptional regulator [Bacilli bacterium]|nr:helix-turn-helix transcriptional regulator [Bacilli bacterium]